MHVIIDWWWRKLWNSSKTIHIHYKFVSWANSIVAMFKFFLQIHCECTDASTKCALQNKTKQNYEKYLIPYLKRYEFGRNIWFGFKNHAHKTTHQGITYKSQSTINCVRFELMMVKCRMVRLIWICYAKCYLNDYHKRIRMDWIKIWASVIAFNLHFFV